MLKNFHTAYNLSTLSVAKFRWITMEIDIQIAQKLKTKATNGYTAPICCFGFYINSAFDQSSAMLASINLHNSN